MAVEIIQEETTMEKTQQRLVKQLEGYNVDFVCLQGTLQPVQVDQVTLVPGIKGAQSLRGWAAQGLGEGNLKQTWQMAIVG